MTVMLPTTEAHEWIWLPFKIRRDDRELTWKQARRRAITYRLAGRLARVVKIAGGYAVATHKPRRNAPRRCDLKI